MDYVYQAKNQVLIWQKVSDLIQAMFALSETLPSNDFHQLGFCLRKSAKLVSVRLEDCLNTQRKIDRIRSMIKINGTLEEVRNYLNLIESMRYANTKKLIDELYELSKLINEEYPEMTIS